MTTHSNILAWKIPWTEEPGRLQSIKTQRFGHDLATKPLQQSLMVPQKMKLKSYLACMHAESLQSCLTLCSPMDCSPPGSSVHGILQARVLEWVVMPSSGGSSQPRDRTQVFLHLLHWQESSLPLVPPEKPRVTIWYSNFIPRLNPREMRAYLSTWKLVHKYS